MARNRTVFTGAFVPPGYHVGRHGQLKKNIIRRTPTPTSVGHKLKYRGHEASNKVSAQMYRFAAKLPRVHAYRPNPLLPSGYRVGRHGQIKRSLFNRSSWTGPVPTGYKLNKRGQLKYVEDNILRLKITNILES